MGNRLTLPLTLVAVVAVLAAALALFDRAPTPPVVQPALAPTFPADGPDDDPDDGPDDGPPTLTSGRAWLTDLPWTLAVTGWVGIGANPSVRKDLTFRDQSISLGGRPYPKGLGVYPFSEVEYALDGNATEFLALAGLDDGLADGQGSVQFHVFVDGVPHYQSPVLRGGDTPRRLRVPVAGGRTLRLVVTDGGDGADSDFAVWGIPRLVTRPRAAWDAARRDREAAALSFRQRQQEIGQTGRADEQARTARVLKSVAATRATRTAVPQAAGGLDPEGKRLVLANGVLAVTLGFGGAESGVINVVRLPDGGPVLADAAPALVPADESQPVASLRGASGVAGGWYIGRFDDAALGPGVELMAHYTLSGGEDAELRIWLGDRAPAFTLQVDSPALAVRAVRFPDQETGGKLALDDGARYLTDYSQVREGRLADDGLVRAEVVGLGKPLIMWSPETARGVVLAVLAPVALPGRWQVQRGYGQRLASFGFEQPLLTRPDGPAPRLYLEAVSGSDPGALSQGYRTVTGRLYPPLPLPSWVRHQWLSWYVYNTDATEDDYRRQIDTINNNLGDLGPWSILIDAGWYVTEGRAGADWRSVDRDKFPNGLRALVEYAQVREIGVVLYFSTPVLDDATAPRNWLGLRGIIDEHPEWLIPITGPEGVRRFMYDYGNPAAREYLHTVIQGYVLEHGADGVKLDGLGGGEEPLPDLLQRGKLSPEHAFLGQTPDIYRATHDAIAGLERDGLYIESGWVTPVWAHGQAHTFRYADESPLWSHPYPFPGLKEHIDYALYQQAVLGQRGNLGAVYSDPNEDRLGLSWLEAGLALGMQVTLSFDLAGLAPETLEAYRQRLAALRPYQGRTVTGPGWPAEVFATTVDGTTYLGILNRGAAAKDYAATLADFGVERPAVATVLDVTRGRAFAVRDTLRARVPADSFRLYVVRSSPGVMWTGSSTVVHATAEGMDVEVQGTWGTAGTLRLWSPPPQAVLLDGEPLAADRWQYNPASSVLTVAYDHAGTQVVSVQY